MKSFIATAFVDYVSANDALFMEHISYHGKSYSSIEEYNLRKANFDKTDKIIKEFNATSNGSFTVGHNHMSDWSDEEKAKLSGIKGDKLSRPEGVKTWAPSAEVTQTLPTNWDWRIEGAVTPVKD